MYITSNKLIYLAIIKQACRDYVEWKRNNDSRLIEVKKFLDELDCDQDCEIDGKWLVDMLDVFAAGDQKRFWLQDLTGKFTIVRGNQ